MKNKDFDTIETVRSIRDRNFEQTKKLSRQELLDKYKKEGKSAVEQFKKSAQKPKVTG